MQIKTNSLSANFSFIPVVTVAIAFMCAGCSKSSSNNPVSSQGAATVQGQLIGGSGLTTTNHSSKPETAASLNPPDPVDGEIQGATVTLAQIQVDGSLKTVSKAAVKTDATGHFAVGTDLNDVSNLVAVAVDGASEWQAIVSGQVSTGNTTDCQPLTNQSTVQAEAYSRVVADGKSNVLTIPDLQLFVSSSVAAGVAGNSGAIAQLAEAMEEESTAQTTAFAQLGVTQSQLSTAAIARQQAQIELESALYSATGDSSQDAAALETYTAATIGAYVATAGIPIENVAKAEEISCSALTSFSASMSAGAQFSVAQSAALVRAGLMSEVVLSELQAGGASQSEVSAANSANTDLLGSISLAVSPGTIIDAFASYHTAIMAQLEAMAGTAGSALGQVDNDINTAGGAHATLETTLNSAGTPGAVVQAYMTYYGSIGTMMQGMGGMNNAQLTAATQILMLIDSN